MMRRTLSAFAAAASLAFGIAADAAPRYTFSQGGFEQGAHVSGWFEGADLDRDGWILSYEVTGFSLHFSGTEGIDSFTHTLEDGTGPGNLAYRIGSDTFEPEPYGGLWTFGFSGEQGQGTQLLRYASFSWLDEPRAGAVILENGDFLATDELLRVRSDPAAVPSPGPLALAGLGLILIAAARRRTEKR